MKKIALLLLGIAAILVLFGGMMGSSLPDGLESVAESLEFADFADARQWRQFVDYEWSALDPRWQVAVGVLGVALLYIFGILFGRRIRRRRNR